MRKKWYKFLHSMSTNRWSVAIKEGLLKVQPLILIVCLLQIILYIISISTSNKGNYIKEISQFIDLFYMVIKIMFVITISYSLGSNNYKKSEDIKPIVGATISLIIVGILTSHWNNINEIRVLYLINAITSILFTLLSTDLFMYFYRIQRKYLKSKMNYYEKITNNFNFIILPAIITIIVCILLKYILIEKIIIILISTFNIDKTNVFIDIILGQVLWFFGGHGGNIIYDNSKMIDIITYSNLGGAGATLSLIIAMYILKSNKEKKRIGIISVIASIFNINEPIVYGLPIIFNAVYIIPFILVPLIATFITISSYNLGIININSSNYDWVMPVFYNGYAITGSFKGIIIQVVNLFVGVLIYMPFVNLSKKINELTLRDNYENFKKLVFSNNISEEKLIERDGEIGDIAKSLAIDLFNAIQHRSELYLEYQPQVAKDGEVVGVEALLRWNHGILGTIPPNIIILLATELEIMNELGKWIIEESCHELSVFKENLDKKIEMSINVASQQLTDESLYNFIVDVVYKYDVDFTNIKLEITETVPLGNDNITKEQIKRLSSLGIKFAIDDFGQGYNPILYLKQYNIDTIKLDGKLIRDIHKNNDSRYIVDTMFNLGKKMNIKIVCEFVENEDQKQILDNMGDGIYQGYLFSKPLGDNEILEYIKRTNIN